jgi:hypothetical protein
MEKFLPPMFLVLFIVVSGSPSPVVVPPNRRARVQSILVARSRQVADETSSESFFNSTIAPFEVDSATRESKPIPADRSAAALDHIVIEMGPRDQVTCREYIEYFFRETPKDFWVVMTIAIVFIIGCVLIIRLLN